MLKGPRGIVYTAEDPEVDVMNRRAWKAANPSLGHPGFDTLARVIEREAKEAAGDEAAEAHFRALRLNQGISEVGDDRMLVKPLDWRACEADELPDREGPLVIAFDLSGGSATCAAVGYWPETGRVEGFVLVPELPTLERRGIRDGVGNLYLQMRGRGELIVAGQRVPDFEALVQEAVDRWGYPDIVVSDPYKVRDLRQALEAVGLQRARFIKRSGGYVHGAEDIRFYRRAVLQRRLRVAPSLAFRSALAEARTMPDAQGRLKLAVRTQGSRRDKARDDLAAALVIAVAVGDRHREYLERKGGGVQVAVA